MRYLSSALWVFLLLGCAESAIDGRIDICSQVHCDDRDDCTTDVCDAADPEVCLFFPAPRNTPCNGGGVCDGMGSCIECTFDEQCPDDYNECTAPRCERGACGHGPVADGTACSGGTCLEGRCALSSFVVPCTEQGIRNAIAAGGGAYRVDCEGPTRVTTEAEIVIDKNVFLGGNGNLTIDGGDDHRVFSVLEGATVWLDGISVTGGFANQSCGGLSNAGKLQLTDFAVLGNAATSGGGGICNSGTLMLFNCMVAINQAQACAGVFNNGRMTVQNSTVSGNVAISGGGGLCSSGVLTLSRSAVVANSAERAGGVESSGALTLSNSTVSSNVSKGTGGGLWNSGAGTVTNSTLSGNQAGSDGAVIRNLGALVIRNSLLDGDCSGDVAAISSEGYNMESPADTCGLDHATDELEVQAGDLGLEPLGNNGGPTSTHALLPGSLAVDRIPEEVCELDRDQRGIARPQGAMCDIGAFELEGGGT